MFVAGYVLLRNGCRLGLELCYRRGIAIRWHCAVENEMSCPSAVINSDSVNATSFTTVSAISCVGEGGHY